MDRKDILKEVAPQIFGSGIKGLWKSSLNLWKGRKKFKSMVCIASSLLMSAVFFTLFSLVLNAGSNNAFIASLSGNFVLSFAAGSIVFALGTSAGHNLAKYTLKRRNKKKYGHSNSEYNPLTELEIEALLDRMPFKDTHDPSLNATQRTIEKTRLSAEINKSLKKFSERHPEFPAALLPGLAEHLRNSLLRPIALRPTSHETDFRDKIIGTFNVFKEQIESNQKNKSLKKTIKEAFENFKKAKFTALSDSKYISNNILRIHFPELVKVSEIQELTNILVEFIQNQSTSSATEDHKLDILAQNLKIHHETTCLALNISEAKLRPFSQSPYFSAYLDQFRQRSLSRDLILPPSSANSSAGRPILIKHQSQKRETSDERKIGSNSPLTLERSLASPSGNSGRNSPVHLSALSALPKPEFGFHEEDPPSPAEPDLIHPSEVLVDTGAAHIDSGGSFGDFNSANLEAPVRTLTRQQFSS
ncbi:MAG: hypothetical protein ACKOAD_06020 [Gammaproteobacteria bacterium]